MPNNTDLAREALEMNNREAARQSAFMDYLELHRKYDQSHTKYDEPPPSAFDAGFDAGEKFEATREEWVAVETGLPKKHGRYLVTRRRRADGALLTREAFYDLEDGFTRTANPFRPISDVIAWMPLPEPYGGKDAQ